MFISVSYNRIERQGGNHVFLHFFHWAVIGCRILRLAHIRGGFPAQNHPRRISVAIVIDGVDHCSLFPMGMQYRRIGHRWRYGIRIGGDNRVYI